MIQFDVPGTPVAKGRPRITTRGGKVRTFTPEKTVAFEQRVAKAAQDAMADHPPFAGAVSLHLAVSLPIPSSWNAKKKAAAEIGTLRPCSRPDLDNYIKAVADGGNGVIWNDDSQIVSLSASKRYAALAGVNVVVVGQ